ncbi:hypothetical protein PanWU01x14_254430 [Parasponia andersonii]|uniref:Uncharacterized protein n=1 Tax=Parasponia andersonii TaxID=3476 RepID=A0A2P5BB45_PARAD|nr:hypothetical protein PanWU01x14_254430 [Parasponia andersonii]
MTGRPIGKTKANCSLRVLRVMVFREEDGLDHTDPFTTANKVIKKNLVHSASRANLISRWAIRKP